MRKARKAFQKWDGSVQEVLSGQEILGSQKIGCDTIFDIKMNSLFTCTARIVSKGHTIDRPSYITSISIYIASLTFLGICMPNLCVIRQYFGFTLEKIGFFRFNTSLNHQLNDDSSSILFSTYYSTSSIMLETFSSTK